MVNWGEAIELKELKVNIGKTKAVGPLWSKIKVACSMGALLRSCDTVCKCGHVPKTLFVSEEAFSRPRG